MIAKLMIQSLTVTLILSACSTSHSSEGQGTGPTPAQRQDQQKDLGTVNTAGLALNESAIGIDLDTLPDAHTWATTACLPPLTPDTLIGIATCKAEPGRQVQIVAANAKQYCSSNTSLPAIGPTKPLSITGCDELAISVFTFKPSLNIMISQAQQH